MPLSDAAIRQARPRAKPRKLYDSRGLYLEIAPRGSKAWRFKYRFADREKRISLGIYPEVSLKLARAAARRGPATAGPRHRPERLPQGPEAIKTSMGTEQFRSRGPGMAGKALAQLDPGTCQPGSPPTGTRCLSLDRFATDCRAHGTRSVGRGAENRRTRHLENGP